MPQFMLISCPAILVGNPLMHFLFHQPQISYGLELQQPQGRMIVNTYWGLFSNRHCFYEAPWTRTAKSLTTPDSLLVATNTIPIKRKCDHLIGDEKLDSGAHQASTRNY